MLLAAPELWVLVMACVILVVDLFLREERRGIIQLLALGTLVFAAIMTLRADYLDEGLRSVTAFNGSFIRDSMGAVAEYPFDVDVADSQSSTSVIYKIRWRTKEEDKNES